MFSPINYDLDKHHHQDNRQYSAQNKSAEIIWRFMWQQAVMQSVAFVTWHNFRTVLWPKYKDQPKILRWSRYDTWHRRNIWSSTLRNFSRSSSSSLTFFWYSAAARLSSSVQSSSFFSWKNSGIGISCHSIDAELQNHSHSKSLLSMITHQYKQVLSIHLLDKSLLYNNSYTHTRVKYKATLNDITYNYNVLIFCYLHRQRIKN